MVRESGFGLTLGWMVRRFHIWHQTSSDWCPHDTGSSAPLPRLFKLIGGLWTSPAPSTSLLYRS
ncbi:hypothetical protein HU200_041712 [Digitaria exilis]|uniref:Uncharacterized protein n=1 Tax=Digitaria exilis TaxID=1010633 RepID=A0A835EDI8_9POAL|nr:hypothetical protein HU200_041712 [Digitaria exilis]